MVYVSSDRYIYDSIKFVMKDGGLFVSLWCRAGRELYEIETLGL